MISRGQNFQQFALNIVGSSVFGRYPKINIEKTYNMFISDNWLVPYAGYQIAIPSIKLGNGTTGRAVYASSKMQKLFVVVDNNVFMCDLFFDQSLAKTFDTSAILIGQLSSFNGVVYIAENNKPQLLFSDNQNLYLYDPTLSPKFQVVTGLSFTPGYITFHDTYFLCAASYDTYYNPPASNTWRLSEQNNGLSFPDNAASIGLIQTKPDQSQAVVRFPSKGNMIYVMGSTVTEPWFDTGNLLFPYTRNNQASIDYGCLSPATVAYMDEIVVWLAGNEKSGAIIMYSMGGEPKKITTDGIDYFFSQMTDPSDSQAFLYRQDGHLFYHINFYKDNVSLFYDFNTDKFYHACDQNLNYFVASQVAFFNNQYYFVSRNDGNLYAFDTIYTTYQGNDALGNVETYEIPRFRTCKNIRLPTQEYHVINDLGFTIETGETNYQQQDLGGDNYWVTQDGKFVITQGAPNFLVTQNGNYLTTQDGKLLIAQNADLNDFDYLIYNNKQNTGISNLSLPRVDLSMSYDGGATFGHDYPYNLNPIGLRKNKLVWWQCGAANDAVPLFKFWGINRFIATDGIINIRQ
jgi:hypothetical protein